MNLLQVRRGLWVPRRGIVAGGGPSLPELPSASLVDWWSMNGVLTSKNSRTLTNNNGVSLGSAGNGPYGSGQACVFDRALSQYLSRAHDAGLAVSGDITVCFHVYPTYMSTDIGIVDKNTQYGVTYDSASGGYPRTWFQNTGYQDAADHSNDWSINTWQHYWMRHDAAANTVELSRDNNTPVTVSSVTLSPDGTGTNSLDIGRFFGTNYFSGRLCELSIWSAKLTDDQLLSIYGDGSTRKTDTDFTWV